MVFSAALNTPFFAAKQARIIKPIPKQLRPVLPTGILQYARKGFHEPLEVLDTKPPTLAPLRFESTDSESEVSCDSDRDFSPGPEDFEDSQDTESPSTASVTAHSNKENCEESKVMAAAEKLLQYILENAGKIRNPNLRTHTTLVLNAVLRARSRCWAKSLWGARFVIEMLQEIPSDIAEDASTDVVMDDLVLVPDTTPPVQYAPAWPDDEEADVPTSKIEHTTPGFPSSAPTSKSIATPVSDHRLPTLSNDADKMQRSTNNPNINTQKRKASAKSKPIKSGSGRNSVDIEDLVARMDRCSVGPKPSLGEVINGLCALLDGMAVSADAHPTSTPVLPSATKRTFDDASSDDDGDDEDGQSAERFIKRRCVKASVSASASKELKRGCGRRAMAASHHSY